MKITRIESAILTIPTAKPIALEFPVHRLVVASVETDEGLAGLGYSLAFGGGGAEAIQVYLETRLKPLLVGEDPLFVERLWERMYRADRGIKRQGVAAYALSALDIALWDLVGKAAGLPLYKLWGATTDRVAAYGSGGWAGSWWTSTSGSTCSATSGRRGSSRTSTSSGTRSRSWPTTSPPAPRSPGPSGSPWPPARTTTRASSSASSSSGARPAT